MKVTPGPNATPPMAPGKPAPRGAVGPNRAARWLVTGVGLTLMAVGISLFGLMTWQMANPPQARTALEILDEIRAEVIPPEGSDAGYGVTFSQAGYDALVAWKDQVPVNLAWAGEYEGLDITLPCCDVAHPFADEKKNCTCGHHQALYGLSKQLLGEGRTPEAVQAEIKRWTAYMYPKETLRAEMERRAVHDPAVSAALEALIEKGEC